MIICPTTDLLTIDDVASEARVVKSTVEGWVYDAELGSFKKGKTRRISRECWVQFVLAHTTNPRRPDWLTPQMESDFQKRLGDIVEYRMQRDLENRVREVVARLAHGERVAA